MSKWRVIDFTEFIGKVTYQRGQLVIEDKEGKSSLLSLADVSVVLFSYSAFLSSSSLLKLAEYDCMVLFCDWRKIPVSALLPWRESSNVGLRKSLQLKQSEPRRKNAWSKIVKAKIMGQSKVLAKENIEKSKKLRA